MRYRYPHIQLSLYMLSATSPQVKPLEMLWNNVRIERSKSEKRNRRKAVSVALISKLLMYSVDTSVKTMANT